MAVRQYIGARYVPKLDGEWSSEKVYEALTIVMYNNGSYTSKKNVPAGVLPTNTEYWAFTGNYNAQVEAYRQEVGALKTDVETYKQETETLKTDFESYKQETETFKTEVEKQISVLSDKTCVFLGDSFGTIKVNDKTMFDICAELCDLPSANYYQSSVSGSGFVAGTTFLTQLQNLSSITNKDSITDIFVIGGANDVTATAQNIKTAIANFKAYVKTNFVNAKVHIGVSGGHWYNPNRANLLNIVLPIYENCVEEKCCYIKGLFSAIHSTEYVTEDLLHPNTEGIQLLGKALAQYILTGNLNNVYSIALSSADMTPLTGVTGINYGYITETVNNDVVIISSDQSGTTSIQCDNITLGLNVPLFSSAKRCAEPTDNTRPYGSTTTAIIYTNDGKIVEKCVYVSKLNNMYVLSLLGSPIENVIRINFIMPEFVIPISKC